MDIKELQKTHKIYDERSAQWKLYRCVTDGIDAIMQSGLIESYTSENSDDYNIRLKELITFSYSESIVNLFSFFITTANYQQSLGKIGNEAQWVAFFDDADLWGNSFDVFLADNQKFADIYGYCGILVDSPPSTNAETYPYVSRYTPENILDWKFEKDENSRPFLSYLKLKDFENEYLIWTVDKWERWASDGKNVSLVKTGDNPLKIIPFVWHIGIQDAIYPYMGQSLIKNVASIDLSISRNLSQAEQILFKSAFPIYRVPLKSADLQNVSKEKEVKVGVSNVAVFDPETGQRPDWMPSEALNPINAILAIIDRKISEIYRSMNLGNLQASQQSMDARSAEALQQEFQLLNITLTKQGNCYIEAKKKVIWFWLKWLGKDTLYPEIEFTIPQRYDSAALAAKFEQMITAKTVVKSDIFNKEIQKNIVSNILPNLSEEKTQSIFQEIESGEMPEGETGVTPEIADEKSENKENQNGMENGEQSDNA